jgi:hypothetical protein
MELVLFESAQVTFICAPCPPSSSVVTSSHSLQVLPCFAVKLSRSRIPRPLLPAPGVPREIDLRYQRMLHGHDASSSASAQLAQTLLQQQQLVAFIQAGEAAAKQRRYAFKSDKLACRSTCHIKSAVTLSMGDQIGIGTFGTVYRAKWQGFDVAVKQLNKVDASTSAALQKEAMIMMGVSSPHIVRVYGLVDQPLGIIMVCRALVFCFASLNFAYHRSLCPVVPCTTACAPLTRRSLPCSDFKYCAALLMDCSRCTIPTSFISMSSLQISCSRSWAMKLLQSWQTLASRRVLTQRRRLQAARWGVQARSCGWRLSCTSAPLPPPLHPTFTRSAWSCTRCTRAASRGKQSCRSLECLL